MSVIYKYELKTPTDDTEEVWTSEIIMPVNAKVLTAAVQSGKAYIWALVDKHPMKRETVKFHIYPTGLQEFDDDNLEYISTLFFREGKYVFHVFKEVIE